MKELKMVSEYNKNVKNLQEWLNDITKELQSPITFKVHTEPVEDGCGNIYIMWNGSEQDDYDDYTPPIINKLITGGCIDLEDGVMYPSEVPLSFASTWGEHHEHSKFGDCICSLKELNLFIEELEEELDI